jgi:hypothetical protein
MITMSYIETSVIMFFASCTELSFFGYWMKRTERIQSDMKIEFPWFLIVINVDADNVFTF